jgi:hypothetical protein
MADLNDFEPDASQIKISPIVIAGWDSAVSDT